MEGISEKFYSTVNDIIPLNLSEGATEMYPYAVYTHSPAYHYTKDSREPHKVSSYLECYLYGKDFDELAELADDVVSAVHGDMNGDVFTARLSESYKDCEDEVWGIQLNFNITQNLR